MQKNTATTTAAVQQYGLVWWYSEWGMRGWSVLRSVLLMGSGVFGWSLLMARWIDSLAFMHYFHT